jgi:hypothetical protein
MAQENEDNTNQPRYLTHDDLNGALASQKREFQKIMQQNQEQFKELLGSFNSAFGPKPEAPPLPTKTELAGDTAELKRQIAALLERDKQRDAAEKQLKMENTLKEALNKNGISSKIDLAYKYLKDQVMYDEDGNLAMKFEVAPGVQTPLPIHEAVARFVQTENGKYLADPKDVRGSGSRSISAPGSQQQATANALISGNSANAPIFKNVKDLKNFVASEMGKSNLKI